MENTFEEQVGYWAHMLDESFRDEKQLNERRMVGPAGAAKGLNGGVDEIADFRQKLEDGVVEFEFTKADGTKRHAVGATSEQIVPTSERRKLDPSYDTNLTSYQHRGAYIIWFWDLDKNAVRCFNTNRFEGIVKYEQTSQHVTPDVKKVGDIYLHQDVDDGMMKTFDPETASQINSQIGSEIASGSNGFSSILVGGGFSNADSDFGSVEIAAGPSNEPILRIEIRKHGSDNDQPYPLKINEMRKYILEKWGVNIKKVIVDGQFEF